MELGIYLVKMYFKTKYNFTNSKFNIISLFLYTLTASVYAFVISRIIDSEALAKFNWYDQVNFINWIGLGLFSLTIVESFITNKKTELRIFNNSLPVSNLSKFNITIIIHFLDNFTIASYIFIMILITTSESISAIDALKFISYVITSNFIIIMYSIWYKKKLNIFQMGLLIISIAIYLLTIYYNNTTFSSITFTIIFYLISFYLFTKSSFKVGVNAISYISNKYLFLKLLLSKRNLYVALFTSLLFKTIALVYFYNLESRSLDTETSFFPLFIIVAVSTPVMLYNSVFNNLWGYLREVWYNISFMDYKMRELKNTHLRLVGFPLILDFIISLVFLIYLDNNFWFLIISYISSTIILTPLSVVWSLVLPSHVNRPFGIKNNVSIVSSLSTVLVSLVLTLPILGKIYYLGYILLYIISIGIFIYYRPSPIRKERMYLKLFN